MVVWNVEGCQTQEPWRSSMIECERTQAAGGRGLAWRRLSCVAALGMAIASCTGSIGPTDQNGPSTGSGSGGSQGTTTTTTTSTGTGGSLPPPPDKFVPQTAGLRRLTIP